MKTLLLLRHGKSDWGAAFEHDHDRPLKKRGRKDARRMGRLLAESGHVPDYVLCSSALRARETMVQGARGGGWEVPVRATEALYEPDPDVVLSVIREVPDEAGVLLAIGHDPAWSELAGRLVGGAHLRIPTAGLARIDLETAAWQEAGAGVLVWLVTPRLVRRRD